MAKTKDQKKQILDSYTEAVTSQNFVLIKSNAVPAANLTNLRKKLSEYGSNLYVVKNSLLRLALNKAELLADDDINENLLLLDCGDGISESLKIMEEEKKDIRQHFQIKAENSDDLADYNAYTFYLGVIQGKRVDENQINQLKDLPSREVLLGQFVGLLNAPLSGFMNVLQGNTRQLMYALQAVQEQKNEA